VTDVSQGEFKAKKRIDGAVEISCPPHFVVPPNIAVQIAQAILKEAGVTVILANPGETVLAPFKPRLVS
jgi:hypothetical protein